MMGEECPGSGQPTRDNGECEACNGMPPTVWRRVVLDPAAFYVFPRMGYREALSHSRAPELPTVRK